MNEQDSQYLFDLGTQVAQLASERDSLKRRVAELEKDVANHRWMTEEVNRIAWGAILESEQNEKLAEIRANAFDAIRAKWEEVPKPGEELEDEGHEHLTIQELIRQIKVIDCMTPKGPTNDEALPNQ